jgi:hypothetical protein
MRRAYKEKKNMAGQTDPVDNMMSFLSGGGQGEAEAPAPRADTSFKPLTAEQETRIASLPEPALKSLVLDLMINLTPDEQEAALADAESQAAPPAPEASDMEKPVHSAAYRPDFIGAGGP